MLAASPAIDAQVEPSANDSSPKVSAMNQLFSPMLADYIWVGGGTLGLILLIVVIVLLLRR